MEKESLGQIILIIIKGLLSIVKILKKGDENNEKNS